MDSTLPTDGHNDRVEVSLASLGVAARDVDATVKHAFQEASNRKPDAAVFLLSYVEYLHMYQRRESFERESDSMRCTHLHLLTASPKCQFY